ncbi:VaFE repeat-containing surface-anchored protein [Trueperella bernardiae]|uniref:VaFE repeat-containing surface-anchored protein n=1 Tax=Trueperella bernardiae TaxID=59561 RepID=UPI0009F6C40C|nr:VaFE repeat-containing surface-anchored protein [Trueperella bernardiae]
MSHLTHSIGVQRRRAAGVVAVFTLVLALFVPSVARADWNATTGRGLEVTGVNLYGPLRLGPHYVETDSIDGQAVEDTKIWCINARFADPGPGEMISVSTLEDSHKWGPDELDLETAQAAWLLNKYQGSTDDTVLAALAYLMHVNFESPKGGYDAQGTVDTLVAQVRAQLPQVDALAQRYVTEARNSAVIGYEKGAVEGEGQRTGVINNIGVHPDNGGTWVSGVPVTARISGPAVFEATGTNVWSGTTQAQPISLTWKSTGNGTVTTNIEYKTPARRTLTKFGADGSVQDMLSYGNRPASDPERVTVEGPSWRVIYDFQPVGTSEVAKVSDDGTFTDTFQAAADPTYGDGKWLELDEQQAGKFGVTAGPVPVTYRVTAYEAGLVPPQAGDVVPEGAKQIGEAQLITANGPGELTASFEGAKPGFATVVWEVVKTDQPEAMRVLIHDDWADGYGVPSETVSVRHPIEIDSSAAIRETKSGTYLVDDLWVTGFPKDHTTFGGDDRFGADVADMTQTLLFFPDGLDVIEANADKAEVIGQITVPAKNGFYPTLGSTEFKVKTDAAGKAVPGTYVFVTSFAGDDRVKPMTTSVEDKREQFTISSEPEIHTMLMYKSTRGAVPAGKVELVDQVSYTNLEPGKEYTLTGTIMVKSTGKALTDAEGKPVETTATFTPEKPNGTQDVVFTADLSGYAGEEVVAFEKLYDGDVELVVHADINDKDQTLKITKLHTTATDKADGDQVMEKKGTQTIVDKVCEHSGQLIPGTTYTITTTLMQDNGQPVLDKDGQPVTVTTPFTPATADECASVEITFDASLVQGSKVVVFEDVLVDDVLIGVHHDLNDVEQTITFKDASRGDAGRGLAFTGASTGPIALLALGLVGAGGLLIYRRKASVLEA